MADIYGNTVQHWRSFGALSLKTTNTDATITLSGGWQSQGWGYSLNPVTARLDVGGTVKNASAAVSSATGETRKVTIANASKTIKRTHAAQNVTVKVAVTNNTGYHNGVSTATTTVTIPALPSYRIAYNSNGGGVAPAAQTKWYGESLILSSQVPSRDSYRFIGWALSASGQVAYKAGQSYTANAAATLYARWERVYSYPQAVTSLIAHRANDSRIDVEWSNNSAMPAEYTAIRLFVETDGGSFVELQKLTADAQNYSYYASQAGHRYRFAVVPENPAGAAETATSAAVYTTPLPPSSIALDKLADGSVQISIEQGTPYSDGFIIERSKGGGAWQSLTTTEQHNYIDTAPGAGAVRYRVANYIDVAEQLVSAFTESRKLVTIAPPAAPSIVSAPAAVIAIGTASITWAPNHPDGSAQAAAQVEVTVSNETTVTTIQGDATTFDLTSFLVAGERITVSVRTLGIDPSYGAWSEPVAFTAYGLPQVSITAPAFDGSTEQALPVAVEWSAADSTGIISQTLRLFDSQGSQLKSWNLEKGVRRFELGAAAYFLENKKSYSVRLDVIAGSTLQAHSARSFDIDYLAPAIPLLDVAWDDERMAAMLTVSTGESGEELPDALSFRVERLIDGDAWLVAEGLASGEQAIDELPPIGMAYSYRVIGTAESGVESAAVFEVTKETAVFAFSFGQAASECLLLVGNPSASASFERAGELFHFAGEELPRWYGLREFDASHSWSFAIPSSKPELAKKAEQLFRRYSIGWVRDPFGHRMRCRLKASMSVKAGRVWQVSINANELEWQEAR